MPRSRRIEYSWLTERLYSIGSMGYDNAQAAARGASLTARAAAAGWGGGGSGGAPDPLGIRIPPELGFGWMVRVMADRSGRRAGWRRRRWPGRGGRSGRPHRSGAPG